MIVRHKQIDITVRASRTKMQSRLSNNLLHSNCSIVCRRHACAYNLKCQYVTNSKFRRVKCTRFESSITKSTYFNHNTVVFTSLYVFTFDLDLTHYHNILLELERRRPNLISPINRDIRQLKRRFCPRSIYTTPRVLSWGLGCRMKR